MKIYRYNLLHAHSQLINWFLALFFSSFFFFSFSIIRYTIFIIIGLLFTFMQFILSHCFTLELHFVCVVMLFCFFIFIRFLLKVNNTTLLLVFPTVFAFGIIPFSFSNSLNSFFFQRDYGIRLTNKYIHGWMPIYYMLYYICFC